MTSLISIRAIYASDPDAAFADARSFESLRRAMRGLATYTGLPESGNMIEGQTYRTDIWFWRLLPVRGHTIKVDQLSVVDRRLLTIESHAGVSIWTHLLIVEKLNDGAVWIDQIRIEAGYQTHLVARFARYVHLRRHRAQGATKVQSSVTTEATGSIAGQL